MRFYLDEDISRKIAEIGRARGLDIISSIEAGMNGKGDEEQLKFASFEGRCFGTCNGGDFMRPNLRFIESGVPHRGILVLTPQLVSKAFGSVVAALVEFAEEQAEGLSPFTVAFLRVR